jgi:hypothetical protein
MTPDPKPAEAADLQKAIDTLKMGIKHDPIALLITSCASILVIKKNNPENLPAAFTTFAALASEVESRYGCTGSPPAEPTDTQRLEWLQSRTADGFQWAVREHPLLVREGSGIAGGCYQLIEFAKDPSLQPTLRAAIDRAMKMHP